MTPSEPERKHMANILDRTTLVPIGAALTVLVVGFSACIWLNSKFSDVTLEISGLKRDVQEIRAAIAVPVWTLRDQKSWAATLKAANPTIVVPEPQ